jgi:hypothetical protein
MVYSIYFVNNTKSLNMKYLKLTKSIAAIALLSLIFVACKKATVSTPLGDAGQTLVKILGGATPSAVAKMPVDFVNTPTKLLVVELRRDIPNETELNKTMIVTVKDDTTAVTAANPAYIQLPIAWFTVQTDGVKTGGQGGTWTFTFKPGEFSKEIYVTIPNATLLDPSSLYGIGFTVLTADAGAKLSTQKSVVIEIGAKNDWDGIYAVTGPMVDLTNATFTQWNNPAYPDPFPQANGGAWELHLITAGASKVLMFDNTIWGAPFHPILSGAANSGWGAYALYVTINPATGTIADVYNYYGEIANGGSGPPNYSASNTRRAVLDPSGVNAVQGNKNIIIKYFMLHPSVVPAPPNIRVTFDELWKYIGPR